jgi:two-component system response regulator
MPRSKPPDLLLVEDNAGDFRLMADALEDIQANLELHHVRDGIETMQFLRREEPFQDSPRPAIIVLDLNLPRKDGRTVLKEIKSDPVLAPIPVIIFSGSDAPQDVSTCYALGANCYIVKPRDLYRFTDVVRCIVEFWLDKLKLPS